MRKISRVGKRHKDNNCSGANSSGKRKRDEPTTTKITKKPKYMAKDKTVYQAKKKEEKVEKGKAAPRQNIMLRVWADEHTGIDEKSSQRTKSQRAMH